MNDRPYTINLVPLSSVLEQLGDTEDNSIIPDSPTITAQHVPITKGDWTLGSNVKVFQNPLTIRYAYSQEGWIQKNKELRAILRQMKPVFQRVGLQMDMLYTGTASGRCNRTRALALCFDFHVLPIVNMMEGEMMVNGVQANGMIFAQCMLEMSVLRQTPKAYFEMITAKKVNPLY